jgi:ribonucleoside-diphosphate reductase alpha chain
MSREFMVVKRNGTLVPYTTEKIRSAIKKALFAIEAVVDESKIDTIIESIDITVHQQSIESYPHVEWIQDIVEQHLMSNGLFTAAKAYILYREEHDKIRRAYQDEIRKKVNEGNLTVIRRDGCTDLLNHEKLKRTFNRVCEGLNEWVSPELLMSELLKNVVDKMSISDLETAMILSAVPFIELDPMYDTVASRLFNQKIRKEIIGTSVNEQTVFPAYKQSFIDGIKTGIEKGLLDKRLGGYNLDLLADKLQIDNDNLLSYMGLQTLYERYFLKQSGKRLELPQSFWMRVAMGLSIDEPDKNTKSLDFYNSLSRMLFVPSTPTLFHSGTHRPQLSSCYITTVNDDLSHIFKCLGDNAQYSKWSGGLGNDWTAVRGTGSHIASTGVESQGVIPFLKIANDVTMAINRSGKRRGATCAYLEIWHFDIEDFLDLKRNTGDERRRTHDMNTAVWIPDLFMKRVQENGNWILFSPDETPDLHDLYGAAFEKRYKEYESQVSKGSIMSYKILEATQLWRKILTRLFETGHPWITFKDPCNVRSPQDHAGIIHSSNLCTEITLNTSSEETAVCNLGSINLSKHINNRQIDKKLLSKTIEQAVRMLDNVIDINFYPVIESRISNLRHRPVGLGIMGLQDVFFQMALPFDSPEAIDLSDNIMEFISYHAILTSSKLAKERGQYLSYKGSKWDRNIFPSDTIPLLESERGSTLPFSKSSHLDWQIVREHVKEYGMRNSNLMAIAPTATIATIAGCYPSIEPVYKNIYVKANISGEFTIVNTYLIEHLKSRSLWNKKMLDDLKYNDGDLDKIESIPDDLKYLFKESFAITPATLIHHAAVRGKWIDQSQSLNLFVKGTSGKVLSDTYMTAWEYGLKTTYYLRTLAASQIEKSTLDAAQYGFTQKRDNSVPAELPELQSTVKACSISNPDCESCQ